MNIRPYVAMLVLPLLVLGCKGGSKASSAANEPPAPVSVKETPAAKTLPASLMTAGYEFSGLASEKKATYEVTNDLGLPASTMIQTSTLVSVESDKAVFEVKRETTLPNMKSQTIELTPDGVFTTKVDLGSLVKPAMEMPADLAPGKEWDTTMTISDSNQTLEVKAVNKATKIETITVKAGTYDCIRIETTLTTRSTVTGTSAPTKTSGSVVSHYAKNVGLVKLVMKGKDATSGNSETSYVLTNIE